MLLHAYRCLAYYGTLACFGVFALVFNAYWALAGRGRDSEARERAVRRSIHRVFHRLTRWAVFARLLEIEYRGFDPAATAGTVVVANHPGLLDAMFLLARMPSAICVFKPSVRHNPLLGPAALRAGYLATDHRLELVRRAATKLAGGATLLVFPEGTRTPANGNLGPFRPGFALIARRAQAPVQLVRITVHGSLLTKERAWWKLPTLPARVVLEAGPRLDPQTARSTAEFLRQVEAWFRRPAGAGHFEFGAFPARSSSYRLKTS